MAEAKVTKNISITAFPKNRLKRRHYYFFVMAMQGLLVQNNSAFHSIPLKSYKKKKGPSIWKSPDKKGFFSFLLGRISRTLVGNE